MGDQLVGRGEFRGVIQLGNKDTTVLSGLFFGEFSFRACINSFCGVI